MEVLAANSHQQIGLIGLTATPFRKCAYFSGMRAEEGAYQLSQIFEKIIEPKASLGFDRSDGPVSVLQERGGVLSKIAWKAIQTQVSLPLDHIDFDEAQFEMIDQQLGRYVDRNQFDE
jgi:hypothetical protein